MINGDIHIPQSQSAQWLDKLPWTSNIPCPEREAIARFQERLNQTIGFAEGHPLVRVVWGGEAMEFGCEEQRAKYLYASAEIPVHFRYADMLQKGKEVLVPWELAPVDINPAKAPELFTWERVDVGTQRFWMEVHVPHAEVAPDWELQRYEWNRDLREQTDYWTARASRQRTPEEEQGRVDVLGPCPDPFYAPMFIIGAHSKRCCNGTNVTRDGKFCVGLFRLPNESDIARVQGMLRGRAAAKMERRPGEAITQSQMEAAAKVSLERTRARDERLQQRIAERTADWMRTHGHRLTTDDPSVHHHGKFHFLTGPKPVITEKAEAANVSN